MPTATAIPLSPPLPPLMPGVEWFGHLRALRKDPLRLFASVLEQPTEVSRLHVPRIEISVLRSPEHVKYVLQDNQKNFSKQTRGYELLRRFLGNGLVTSEGAHWLKQRRIAQPGFHRQRIGHFAEVMVTATEEMLERWAPLPARGGTVDLAAEMMALTLGIVGRTLLSADVREDVGSVGPALTELLHQVRLRSMMTLEAPDWMPTPMNRRFVRASDTLDSVIFRIIAERRATPGQHADLLAMLMEAKDEETGEGMSDLELRDELMTLILAGHETTATALSWTFALLAKHPAVLERLEQELASVLEGRAPRLEDVLRLSFTHAVVQEAMRLYPPVWVMMRRIEQDDEIGGFRLNKGNLVATPPWVVHRNPRVFEHPDQFDPDRFLGERGERIPRFGYFPFSGGPRICIGNTFAMMEAQLILARTAQRYRLQLIDGVIPKPEPTVTLRPAQGLTMKVTSTGTRS